MDFIITKLSQQEKEMFFKFFLELKTYLLAWFYYLEQTYLAYQVLSYYNKELKHTFLAKF